MWSTIYVGSNSKKGVYVTSKCTEIFCVSRPNWGGMQYFQGKVALYTQQTYVGVGLLLGLRLGELRQICYVTAECTRLVGLLPDPQLL